MREKVESFLTHVFIKRQQSTFFENLKSNLNDETICIQVDFSENFRIDIQDAIQSSYYSKNSVSLFTCYIWHLNGGRSCVYASDDLSHDKYHVSTALDHLFDKLKNQFQRLKYVHMFPEGATQQFKQKFLFWNLCRLSDQLKVDIQVQASSSIVVHIFKLFRSNYLGISSPQLMERELWTGSEVRSNFLFIRRY